MHASRFRKGRSKRPNGPLSLHQLEFDYAVESRRERSQRRSERRVAAGGVCTPFDGPESKWRQRAVHQCWTELGIERPALAWPSNGINAGAEAVLNNRFQAPASTPEFLRTEGR